MERLPRGLIGLVVVVVAFGCGAIGCGTMRGQVRYGSLKLDERTLSYKPRIEWWGLPNGLTVAIAPDDRTNLVSVDVRYLVGAADDPPGKTGLAHLVEHLMFELRTTPDGPTLADRLALLALG